MSERTFVSTDGTYIVRGKLDTYVLPSPTPSSCDLILEIRGPDDNLVLGIKPTGEVVFGEGVTPTDAAREFFDKVLRFTLEYHLSRGGRRR